MVALAAALAFGVAGCVPPDEPGTESPSGGGNAVQQLGQLTVATAGSMKGYSRDHFPHWRNTGKNCDVRDTILQRDGKDVKLSGCNVVGGRWESVYDGRSAADPSDVDIDHMVPLANAWRSGADEWDDQKRGDFANDTTRPQLLAVSASSNRAKGDQDPSQWKPANREYWCKYAESWVTVKHHWRLTVTSAEKTALTDMLEGCTVGNAS
ncbi:Protein of unknown function [Micromonospora chokoriensis]|uniref:GmrSD restriction endonucleases C-terminal domain-containing protein n=1 Tax=Micromonospora chokoriensis TaxID=356851 RepID=A0A1C4VJA9_9ACTN|nr:Protein of unknown function [Micromonospora chokoriensis]